MTNTSWHLVSWRLHDGSYRDTVFVMARLVDGELETRNPYLILDSLRQTGARQALPWLKRITRREAAYIERMVVALEERAEKYPLAESCIQCGRRFERCDCTEINQDWSVA